jgi:hypothetical protein
MKRAAHFFALLGWLLWVAMLSGAVGAERREQFPGAIPLFNGTNLSGWYSWLVDTKRDDPRRVFTATNRLLRISGDGLGYLATEQEFSDYRLIVEFKWGATNTTWGGRLGKARDSGVFLHSIGPDGNSHDGRGAFRAAIECQIMEGATGDFLLIRGTNTDGSLIAPRVTVAVQPQRDVDGWPFADFFGKRETIERWGRVNWVNKSREWKDVFDFRGPHDAEKPRGEWNELAITCQDDHISVELNGVTVNEAHKVWPKRGKILLQCEGSEIFFRHVALVSIARR